MASTGRIFYNAVRSMSREELLQFVSMYASTLELKVLLNTFDELRKGCVLAEEMKFTLAEATKQLSDIYDKANEPLTVKQAYLKILEGQIMMLILSQHMAKDLRDQKKMFANSQRITELFTEYQMEGGTRSFQSPASYINQHTMKIERGIIIADEQGMAVRSPGHIYHLNNEAFFRKSLNENDKVLGVIINKKFSVCREFISVTGHFVFGYVKKESNPGNQLSIQIIPGFEPNSFNPFEAEYDLGEVTLAEI